MELYLIMGCALVSIAIFALVITDIIFGALKLPSPIRKYYIHILVMAIMATSLTCLMLVTIIL